MVEISEIPLLPPEAVVDDKDKKEEDKERGRKEKEEGKRLKKIGKGASIVGSLIVPVGLVLLGYYVLKTWHVIEIKSTDTDNWKNWKPLSDSELEDLENTSILLDNVIKIR